jgi:altronate dehydratase small subunit
MLASMAELLPRASTSLAEQCSLPLSTVCAATNSRTPSRRIDVIRKAILLDPRDQVATALTDLKQGERVNASLDDLSIDVILCQDIEFGHKVALRDIPEGEPILKYGLPIGKALTDIRAGEWVHVHNCRSERFGFHRQKYGLNA